MTAIQKGSSPLTLINVFHVRPENQQALVDVLTEATAQTMQHQPGFVSANIHKSHDGRRVVNYAQWRSQQDFEAMQEVDEARPHMKLAAELAARYDPIVCEVASIHQA